MQLTSAGWPAISYYDYTNNNLKYTYKDASGWHNQVVDSSGGGFTSLRLTAAGWPAISYHDCMNYALKYTYKDASGWHNQLVDSVGSGCSRASAYTSLAITSTGWPAIGYADTSNDTLKYTYKDASGWHNQVVDSAGAVCWFGSLQLTSTGWPAISYYDADNGTIKYAYK